MRKLVAFVIAVAMFVSGFVFSTYAETSNNSVSSEIVAALNSAEYVKDRYGLSNVDFAALTYCNSIYAYDYTEEGLVYNSEFIPIMHDNTLVGWVIKAQSEPDTMYQFSTAFVNNVNSIDNITSFAFIYDYNACYLYDGTLLYKLDDIDLEVPGRETLNEEDLKTASIILRDLSNPIELNYVTPNTNTRTPVYYECNVSYVTQLPPSNMCWAASVACVANYFNGTNLTAVSVARKWYNTMSDYNHTLTIGLQDDVLRNYGITYTYRNQAPSSNVIFENIYYGYPIIGTFSWSNGHHDAVIYGVNAVAGYIYIMDPDGGFCDGSYTASVGYRYINPRTGIILTLVCGTCKLWP